MILTRAICPVSEIRYELRIERNRDESSVIWYSDACRANWYRQLVAVVVRHEFSRSVMSPARARAWIEVRFGYLVSASQRELRMFFG